jgi:RES domain
LTTWTPRELESNARRLSRKLWRVVESQHAVATLRLVDSLAEQAALESILEESKPELAENTAHLHYLLATPFRYRSQYGSRFRRAFDAGVFYGAEQLRTALAEKSFWLSHFFRDSPALHHVRPLPQTAFVAEVGGKAVDLTREPLAGLRPRWTQRKEYAATQSLAATVREARIPLIRYESVRDPEHGACVAVLEPRAFKNPRPLQLQQWFIAVATTHASCIAADRSAQWEFSSQHLFGN